jgi:hypothetical protein
MEEGIPAQQKGSTPLRPNLNRTTPSAGSSPIAQLCIGAGLTILLVQIIWIAMPVATAFALVAFGASMALCNRVQHLGWPRDYLLIAHLLTYVVLYLLLIAAMIDVEFRAPAARLSTAQYLDLILSAIVMANATRTCVASLSRSKDHTA